MFTSTHPEPVNRVKAAERYANKLNPMFNYTLTSDPDTKIEVCDYRSGLDTDMKVSFIDKALEAGYLLNYGHGDVPVVHGDSREIQGDAMLNMILGDVLPQIFGGEIDIEAIRKGGGIIITSDGPFRGGPLQP